MSASAPQAAHIEPEPPEWQPRSLWVTGRLLCGAVTFFFASFLFAYVYLRALDTNHAWTIGHVHPSQGLGFTIVALYVLSALIYRLVAKTQIETLYAGAFAVLVALPAVALQFFEYTTLDFGAASGGYAAVFFGWTATYAVIALMGAYWVEVQVASLWRVRRAGRTRDTEVPTSEDALLEAGIEASSYYWAYFVAVGVVAWIVLYLVGP